MSANLCSALAELFLGEEDGTLEIGLRWSPLRPKPQISVSSVWLEASSASVFHEACRVLKQRAPREDFSLVGSVIRLQRRKGSENGKAVIYRLVDESYRGVTVTLEPTEYELATNAHGSKAPVKLEGELHRVGKRFHLKHPRNFQVVELPEDSDEMLLDF